MPKRYHPKHTAFLWAACFGFWLFFCMPAIAQPHHALVMHGAPKYAAGFTHFDYVNPSAPKGGTIVFGVTGSFDSLQPWLIKGQAAAGLNTIYEPLMIRAWDEPFGLYGLIAERVDYDATRGTIDFYLNTAARFHDGAAITTADVEFSFEHLKKQGRPNTRRMYAMVRDINIINEQHIRFVFRDGYDRELPMILAMMTVLPRHDWQDKDFAKTTLTPPLGSGPYRIETLDAGRSITYRRVADYWGRDLPVNRGLYNADIIRYDYYRDEGVALQAFKAGAFDIRREGNATRWATAYTGPAFDTKKLEKLNITDGKPDIFRALVFNTRRDMFQDINVRRALALMLDFDWLNKALYHGLYQRTQSIYPKSVLAARGAPSAAERALLEPLRSQLPDTVWGDAWQAPSHATDVLKRDHYREAYRLLQQAGYTLRDGVMVNTQSGAPFRFEILLADASDEKLALEYARALKKLGITARVRTVDSAQYFARLNDYDYDMIVGKTISSLSPGSEQMVYWGSASAQQKASRNYAGIQSPAIDALAAGLNNARDYDELITRARALDRAIMHGAYFIPLYYQPADWLAVSTRIGRPATTPLYGAVFESWWDKTAQN